MVLKNVHRQAGLSFSHLWVPQSRWCFTISKSKTCILIEKNPYHYNTSTSSMSVQDLISAYMLCMQIPHLQGSWVMSCSYLCFLNQCNQSSRLVTESSSAAMLRSNTTHTHTHWKRERGILDRSIHLWGQNTTSQIFSWVSNTINLT